MNDPQAQTLDVFKFRPIVSAVLIALLVVLIFAARGHRGEDQGQSLGSYAVTSPS